MCQYQLLTIEGLNSLDSNYTVKGMVIYCVRWQTKTVWISTWKDAHLLWTWPSQLLSKFKQFVAPPPCPPYTALLLLQNLFYNDHRDSDQGT